MDTNFIHLFASISVHSWLSFVFLSDFAKPLATVRISEEGSSFAKASTGHVVEQLRLQINVHLPWSSTLTSLHNGSRCAQSSSCSIFFF